MGVDEGNLQVTDVEMIVENCPRTVPTIHTYKYHSKIGVEMMESCVVRLAKRGSTNLYCRLFTVLSIRSMFGCNSHYILYICDGRRGKG